MPDAPVRFPYAPVQPGAFSNIDTAALGGTGLGSTAPPVVAIIGEAEGGEPEVPLTFANAQAAKSVLRDGPAYRLARLAFLGGAFRVVVVRVGTGILQSDLDLAGAAGTPVTLTSIDHGAWTTGISVVVEANNKVTISYTNDRGITFTEVYPVGTGATAAEVAAAINGESTWAASQFVTATANAGTMPLAAAASAPLAGGSDGSGAVAGDWTAGLAALETEDVSIVVPATDDATVHAQVETHVDLMSAVDARRERTSLVGGPLGETVAQAIARAEALAAKRVQLVYPGGSLPSDTGLLTEYAPYELAALVAGAHCSLPDEATSLIHYRLPLVDIETRLSTVRDGDLDDLLRAGVTPFAPAPGGGFWIVDSLTTQTADRDFLDFHKVRSTDACAKRLRERLENVFVGRKALNGTADEVRLEATSELTDQATAQLIRDFAAVTVAADQNDPRKFLVTAPVVPVDSVKFVLITVALQPPGA